MSGIHTTILKRFGRDPKIIFDRDGWKCLICGKKEDLTINHIDGQGRNSKIPNNDLNNLETLCRSCHSRKDRLRTSSNAKPVQMQKCRYCEKEFHIYAYKLYHPRSENDGKYCSLSCAAKDRKTFNLPTRRGVN